MLQRPACESWPRYTSARTGATYLGARLRERIAPLDACRKVSGLLQIACPAWWL